MAVNTKQDYLLKIDFHYLIKYSSETKLYRNYRKYFTKKDFVNALLRNLTREQSKDLYDAYINGVSAETMAQSFLSHNPTSNLIRTQLIEYLSKDKHDNEVIFYEFPVLNNRTDLTRVNGYSYNYEIKTGRDQLSRLQNQMDVFSTVFEKNLVVCPNNSFDSIQEHIPDTAGIFIYELFKEGIKFKENMRPRMSKNLKSKNQLKILTVEALKLLHEKKIGKARSLSREQLIDKILSRYSDKEINNEFKFYLKMKYSPIKNGLITQYT